MTSNCVISWTITKSYKKHHEFKIRYIDIDINALIVTNNHYKLILRKLTSTKYFSNIIITLILLKR